jgi:NAD-reducing hydrogenase large subunit
MFDFGLSCFFSLFYPPDMGATTPIPNVPINLAMNKGVLQAARYYVRPEKLTEGMLNRVEAVIRAFDPCLACSTHADGHMDMQLEMFAPDGKLLDTLIRE